MKPNRSRRVIEKSSTPVVFRQTSKNRLQSFKERTRLCEEAALQNAAIIESAESALGLPPVDALKLLRTVEADSKNLRLACSWLERAIAELQDTPGYIGFPTQLEARQLWDCAVMEVKPAPSGSDLCCKSAADYIRRAIESLLALISERTVGCIIAQVHTKIESLSRKDLRFLVAVLRLHGEELFGPGSCEPHEMREIATAVNEGLGRECGIPEWPLTGITEALLSVLPPTIDGGAL